MGRRTAILAGWAVLVAAVLVALPLAVWPRLPEPMATHWSGVSPDGAMSRTAAVLVLLAIWVVTAGLAVLTRAHRVAAPMLAGTGVLFAGLQAWTVWANLGRTDWHDAAPIGWPFAVPFVLAVAAGYAAWAVDRRFAPPAPAEPAAARPRLDLRPGERVAWTGEVVNRPMLVAGTAVMVAALAGAVCALVGPGRPLLPAVAAVLFGSLVVLVFAKVRVTADPRGLRVVFGPFGWPVQRVALGRITDVTVRDLRPAQVGGWGYRGLPGAATVMLRSGPCLVVRYDGGRSRLTVSVDGAGEAAAVLNGLRVAEV